MLTLASIGQLIAQSRKAAKLSQSTLARNAKIGRSTLDALENGRLGELGYSKITNILSALGLELQVQNIVKRRPTLEDLLRSDQDD